MEAGVIELKNERSHAIYLYHTYQILYCTGHIQMTSNQSTIKVEEEEIKYKNVNVAFYILRISTTLYHTYHLLYYSSVSVGNVLMLWYPLLIHVNVVILIYLGWIYSCHVSSKERTQRCCFNFNIERSQSRCCQWSKCSCTYVI